METPNPGPSWDDTLASNNGILNGVQRHSMNNTKEQLQLAAKRLAEQARDADELRDWLAMLGIVLE